MNKNSAIAQSWDELQHELFTEQEIAASNLRVSILGEILKARRERGITQKQLAEMSGVKQSTIARMEKDISISDLETVIKLLVPLGKTLAVVPLDNQQ